MGRGKEETQAEELTPRDLGQQLADCVFVHYEVLRETAADQIEDLSSARRELFCVVVFPELFIYYYSLIGLTLTFVLNDQDYEPYMSRLLRESRESMLERMRQEEWGDELTSWLIDDSEFQATVEQWFNFYYHGEVPEGVGDELQRVLERCQIAERDDVPNLHLAAKLQYRLCAMLDVREDIQAFFGLWQFHGQITPKIIQTYSKIKPVLS